MERQRSPLDAAKDMAEMVEKIQPKNFSPDELMNDMMGNYSTDKGFEANPLGTAGSINQLREKVKISQNGHNGHDGNGKISTEALTKTRLLYDSNFEDQIHKGRIEG